MKKISDRTTDNYQKSDGFSLWTIGKKETGKTGKY